MLTMFALYRWLSNKYNGVDSSLLVPGYIADRLLHFKDEESLLKIARRYDRYKPSPKGDIEVEEKSILTRNNRKVRILIYKSKNGSPNATGLLWIHGGGYAINHPESEVSRISDFIHTANTVVISPDYTLSVEAPYPCAFEDCYSSLLWMKNNALDLGINSNQLFIGGGSAGGGMAAALSLYARDKKEVNIAYQITLYPMLDDRTTSDTQGYKETLLWDQRKNEIAWRKYLDILYGSDAVPKYAAPARETDYRNLPATFSFVGTEDPFYGETLSYIKALKEADVTVEFYEYKGCFHAFDTLYKFNPLAEDAQNKLLDAYKYATENY